ncbi:MAG TPA: DUF6688 family protein [Thermoguttaceae bacterium]|nr:DUF6688 family protein [Thermoguttaceae bacterium]
MIEIVESDMQPEEERIPTLGPIDPPRLLWSRPVRTLLIMAGVVLPVICFVIGFPEAPDWQSGSLSDYAKLLLRRPSYAPLYPFLLYSMVCLTLVVRNPAKWSKAFFVRLGIYGGVLIALEYWVLFGLTFDGKPLLGLFATGVTASIFGVILALLLLAAFAIARNFRRCLPFLVVVAIVAIGIELLVVFNHREPLSLVVLAAGFFGCLYCSTPWATAAYSIVAIDLLRQQRTERFRFSLAQLFVVITWLAAHFGAWRGAVNWMLIEYAKLPTTPPDDCYVCTAAAKGHARLTRAERYRCLSGRHYRVSDQMRRLKAAELILRHTSPRLHRTCRTIYDRTGPPLAARLARPWRADIAYLSLKPLEWTCWTVLRVLLPKSSIATIHGLYGNGMETNRRIA